MLYCFYPKTKGGNAADHSFKFFTQELFHVFNLLIFICSSLRFHRRSFSLACMLAFFLHLFIDPDLFLYRLVEYAMDHHIRVAPYRRREMTIIFKSQSIVTN